MQIFVDLHVNKTNFHMKGFALGLALKQRRSSSPLSLYRVHNEDLSFPTKDETTSRAYDDTSELHCFNSPGYSSGILQANAMRTTTIFVIEREAWFEVLFVCRLLIGWARSHAIFKLSCSDWLNSKEIYDASKHDVQAFVVVCFCFLKWLVCVTDTNKDILTN